MEEEERAPFIRSRSRALCHSTPRPSPSPARSRQRAPTGEDSNSAHRRLARRYADSCISPTAGPPRDPRVEAEVPLPVAKRAPGCRQRHWAEEGNPSASSRDPRSWNTGPGEQVSVHSRCQHELPLFRSQGQGSMPQLSPGASLPDAAAVAGGEAPGARTSVPPPF